MDPETVMQAIRSLDERLDSVNNKLDNIQSVNQDFITSMTQFIKIVSEARNESYDINGDGLIDDSIANTVNPTNDDETTSKKTSKSNLMLSNMRKMIGNWHYKNENVEKTLKKKKKKKNVLRKNSSANLVEPSISTGRIDDHIVSNNFGSISPTEYANSPEIPQVMIPSYSVKYSYMDSSHDRIDENGEIIEPRLEDITFQDIENDVVDHSVSHRIKYDKEDMSLTIFIPRPPETTDDDIVSDDVPIQETVTPKPVEELQEPVIGIVDCISKETSTNTTNMQKSYKNILGNLVPKIIIERCDSVNYKKFKKEKKRKSFKKTEDCILKYKTVTPSKKKSSDTRRKLIKKIRNLSLEDTPEAISFENGSIPVTPTSSNVIIQNETKTSRRGRVLKFPLKLMPYHIDF